MNSSSTASAEVGLRLVVPDRTTVPLLATLEYAADDPYAIRVAFHVGDDDPVEWIFARELLTVGVVRRAGDGDVQVWPGDDAGEANGEATAESTGEGALNLSLSSPFGTAHFEA